MLKESFEKKALLIYGIGGNGINVFQQLNLYYDVLGFIDKRAKEIGSYFGKQIFTLEDISEKLSDVEKKNIIVIITVKDVFIHSEIAKKLLKNGFSFLIYKPLNIIKNKGNEVEILINNLYESIVEKKGIKDDLCVPETKEIRYEFENRLLIQDDKNEITTWLPVELLFNYKNSYDYPGINIPLFFPLIELYKAFLGDANISLEEAIDHFYLYCGEWLYQNGKTLTKEQKRSFLESRISIFEEMQKFAEVDIKFFVNNAPYVEKEERRFYLKSSGRNRVSFLIAKGFKYVPVRMCSKDYIEWCDIDSVLKRESEINDNNYIDYFFAPYPNPYIIDYSVCFIDYQRLFLQPIANEITKAIYLKHRIYEETFERMDFLQVEEEKRKTLFYLLLDDDGIAEEYFEQIGFVTNEVDSYLNAYLIFDTRCLSSHVNIDKCMREINFEKIFYLQTNYERNLEVEKNLKKFGYNKYTKMFESVCREGAIYGFSVEKEIVL